MASGLNTDSSFTCPWSPYPYSFSKGRHFSLKPAGSDKIFTQKFLLARRLSSGLRNRVHKRQIYQTLRLDVMNCNASPCPSLYFYPMQGAFQAMIWPQYLSRKWFWCVWKCFRNSVRNILCDICLATVCVVSCFAIHLCCRSLKAASFHLGMLLGKGRSWKWDTGLSPGTCEWGWV